MSLLDCLPSLRRDLATLTRPGHAALTTSLPPSWVGTGGPSPDRLVVCHGDACAPNTLIADDGAWAGHVDLGDLGVADWWADLAIATLSLDWNYPGGPWRDALLDAYGVAPDEARITHYRSRWDAASEPHRG